MPLLAAGLGVVGGIAGAFIGGSLANEGQERRLKSERSDAAQALRRETYAEFIGSADEVALALQASSPDQIVSAFGRLLGAKGRVLIVAEDNAEVGDAAGDAFDALSLANDEFLKEEDEKKQEKLDAYYGSEEEPGAITEFLLVAQGDIEAAKE
jgi:hypothetical protein